MSKYLEIEDIEDYNSFLYSLKQELLLLIHLKFSSKEILDKLVEKKIEKEIISIIMDWINKVIEENRKELVQEKDPNKLIRLWYKQYTIFGKDHYPDLIIFDFQKKEIELLLNEYNKYFNEVVKERLKNILNELYEHKFDSYQEFKENYFKFFNVEIISAYPDELLKFSEDHKFGDFIDEKIMWSGLEDRIIKIFLIRMKFIILGGSYHKKEERYVPFFMKNKEIISDMKKYLKMRLKEVIKTYFSSLFTSITIPKIILPEIEKYSYFFEIPPVTFKLFEEIDWDFMPRGGFYDGLFLPKDEDKMGKIIYRTYIINLHPLSAFYTYFNRNIFTIFIDQLIHHEFIHVQQIIYARIFDLINSKSNPFSLKASKFILMRAKQRWVVEEKPNEFNTLMEYLYRTGAHLDCFMVLVNKFKNCERAMDLRGKMMTLYASFYWKLWGEQSPISEGKWFMCDPKIPEEVRKKMKCGEPFKLQNIRMRYYNI